MTPEKHIEHYLGVLHPPVAWVFPRLKIIYVPVPRVMTKSVLFLLWRHETGEKGEMNPYNNEYDLLISPRDVPEYAAENGYFSFSVIRDPFDRLVSAYKMISWDMANYGDESQFYGLFGELSDFPSFVHSVCGCPESYMDIHFRPQSCFLWDEITHESHVDRVWRMEDADAWWPEFLEAACLHPDSTLPMRRDPFDGESHGGYFDDETRRLAAVKYAEDIWRWKRL